MLKLTKRPIGVYDSGVGGLTVFKELRKRFPYEDLIYFGDTARVPYGPKSRHTIREYSLQNARFLNSFHVKLIVIACNTSSAYAIDYLKEQFKVPVIGVIEPGAKKASAATQKGTIGIIGTEGTVNSRAYPEAIKIINPALTVVSRACPLFVPLVEEGWENHLVAKTVAEEYLSSFISENIDTLVLGCTHYPVLKQTIQSVVGDDVILIDSAEAVGEHLDSYLGKPDWKNDNRELGRDFFYVSDNEEKFRLIASRILNQEILNLHRVKLGESWFV